MKKLFFDFVNWAKPSFEGQNGTASFRRFTAFFLVMLDMYLILADKINEDQRVNVYYANLVAVLLIIGIVTTQNVLQFFNRGKEDKTNGSEH